MLEDPEPRVRLFAAMALHHLAGAKELKAITQFIATLDEEEIFLRHGGVRALTGAARDWPELLAELHRHQSQAVRLAGVIASRRLHEAAEEAKILTDPDTFASIAVYLDDLDELVATEAARAIHDMNQPSRQAMQRLATLLDRKGLSNKALIVRAINANRWLGGEQAAMRLAALAANDHMADHHRLQAVESFATWLEPQALDLVLGSARPMTAFPGRQAHAALDRHFGRLLENADDTLLAASTRMIQKLGYQGAEARLLALLADQSRTAKHRADALEALISLKSTKIQPSIEAAKNDSAPELRRIAQAHLTRQQPNVPETEAMLIKATKSADLLERQQAYHLLGEVKAVGPLQTALQEFFDGKADPSVQLDILEAAQAAKLEVPSLEVVGDSLAAYRWSVSGGHPTNGETVFKTSIAAQCVRCHQLNGIGGEIGPDLTGVATRLNPEQLLSSLVTPQAEIAQGYGLVTVTLRDGKVVAGTLLRSNDDHLVMKELDETIRTIAKNKIIEQTTPVTSMPALGAILSKRELRDLLAFLQSLQEENKPRL